MKKSPLVKGGFFHILGTILSHHQFVARTSNPAPKARMMEQAKINFRNDGLQLDENRPFQERFWKVQRIAWVLFGVLIILAILGFTGNGGLYHKQSIQFGSAKVEIPRIMRWEAQDRMTITFESNVQERVLVIDAGFFDLVSIEGIDPEPDIRSLLSNGQMMRFLKPYASPEAKPVSKVTFRLRPVDFGWTNFGVSIGDEVRRLWIVVLP